MRIGIDCRLWNETGVGRYTRNLVKNLQIADKSNEYTLFVLSKDYESIKYYVLSSKYHNWKIVRTNIRWHTVEEQLKFPNILNKENLDLMHFPYISAPFFYSKPFVVTIHDLIPLHFPTGEASTLPLPLYKIKLLGYKFILSAAAKKAKKIITVSNATKKEIIDHLKADPNRVVVAYEGVSFNSKFKIQNSKFKIQKYFLYAGNVFPHKNIDRLLEAFNLLVFQHSEISLVMVGKEDYFYKRLKDKVRSMGLQKSVLFYGEVSDEELVSLYRNAKALIMPSLMEGFGLPVLEAMANKCLVLGSNIPALGEICGDGAIYFDPYDINDIARKMKEVYYDNTYHHRDKIKKGLERSKKFSWEKMAKETLKIYESSTCVRSGE